MSKHKLLLADDSVTIQKVVNLTFADEGIEVIAVGDGNSAMEKFVEDTPDLVMVDVNMPGVDGYRICEMIKQDDETKHVPVILLVGSFEPFDENEARRVGANDYLTKPFQSIRQLVNKVTVLLNKSNGNEAAAQVPQVAETQPLERSPSQEQPISEEQSPTIEDAAPVLQVQEQTEEIFQPLGDAGMDDDMIQTNQIGSLPTDETSRFESGAGDFSIDPLQNQLKSSTYDSSYQQTVEDAEDVGKTQQYTAKELEELTETPAEEESYQPPKSSQNYSSERISAEERAISLEKQMVSEFETESDEASVSHTTSPEELYIPEEIKSEDQISVEEVRQEKGFFIEELDGKAQVSDDQNASPSESEKVLEEIYDAPEESVVSEQSKQEYYSEPQRVEFEETPEENLYYEPETFVTQDLTPPTSSYETEIQPQSEVSNETEQFDYRTSENLQNEPETVSEQPTYFQEEKVSELIEPEQTFESPVETAQPEQSFETQQYSADSQESEAKDSERYEARTNSGLSSEIRQSDSETSSETAFPPFKFTAPEQYFDLEPEAEKFEDEMIEESEAVEFESETVANEETAEPETEQLRTDVESTTYEVEDSAEIEISEDETVFGTDETVEPETSEDDTPEIETLESETVETETVADSETESVSAQTFVDTTPTETEIETSVEPEQDFVAEDSTPTIEIPTAFPTIDDESFPTEEEEEPALEENVEASEPEPKEEKTETQVNTLISGKDKNDAVESVIVSEFARHSISLSSEAVETIATRIADKISEKIIERMAEDVVGSLADRIVEKMERKKLE